jgi:hypothetical protein
MNLNVKDFIQALYLPHRGPACFPIIMANQGKLARDTGMRYATRD